MAKHKRKIDAGVLHRALETPPDMPDKGLHYIKPGSQNRKMVWDKAPKK